MDTAFPAQGGRGIEVRTPQELQAALAAATCGDTIRLAAGGVFTGNFLLPDKVCAGWVVIRTSSSDSQLPPSQRVTPADAPRMARIATPNDTPAIQASTSAHHYRLVGLEITASSNHTYSLVDLGSDVDARWALPHHIVIDRCYLHGNEQSAVRRAVALNGADLAVVDSYISEIHEEEADSQAIVGWNGPGPFTIVNNHLEAAGENVMFGGARPRLANNTPSDIELRHNHFAKPLSWWSKSADYVGRHWSVKNLFELKNAARVLLVGNILEFTWADAQAGVAIVLTPRSEGGSVDAVVSDITMRDNIVRHAAAGVNISGRDPDEPPGSRKLRAQRIRLYNNWFYDVDGDRWGGGNGYFVQVLNGVRDVTIEHNTAAQSGNMLSEDGDLALLGFVFRDNVVPHNQYGVWCSGVGLGIDCLKKLFPDAIFLNNVLIGVPESVVYPEHNYLAGDWRAVVDTSYRIAAKSRYRKAASDGSDPGVDMDALLRATSEATTGRRRGADAVPH